MGGAPVMEQEKGVPVVSQQLTSKEDGSGGILFAKPQRE
jgi:hypothetical protein